jgi:large subunit ribosomal protein L9
MKVILNDYIENLGERGDSVVVKRGYAANYLLPKGLAYPDTPGNRRRFEQEQGNWEEMDLERRAAGEKLAAELDGTKLAFERRAGEKDVLFGSVSVADIHRELQERGFDLDRKRILLEHPIKELGAFDVKLQIHRDISVNLPVRVVRPGEDPDAIAPEFVDEGRLEVSDEDLPPKAEAETTPEIVEHTTSDAGVPEAEDRSETGMVAE